MFRYAQVETILPAVAVEDLQEGHAVVLKPHTYTYNYGSREDLPGVQRPTTTAELEKGAVYVVAHPPAAPNQDMPIYLNPPYIEWSLRLGFDKPSNAAFQTTVLTVPPSVAEEPIPVYSGSLALAVRGVVAIVEDFIVNPASIQTGDFLTVELTGTNHGKFKPAGADPKVAQVIAVETFAEDTSKKQFLIKLL